MAAGKRPGQSGEDMACAHLEGRGMRVLERNFRCRGGEIDLIVRDREAVVFVEVKERTGDSHGVAIEAVTPLKRRRLMRAARIYAAQHGLMDAFLRFDVVAIDWGPDGPRLRHEMGAFGAD